MDNLGVSQPAGWCFKVTDRCFATGVYAREVIGALSCWCFEVCL